MCGIAGIIKTRREENASSLINRLQKMTDAQQHRGPDGEGIWINEDETAGLGHRRLSIIDLSDTGSQPLHFMDRYSIVHNGEIYNCVELKEELQKKNYSFRTKTDTEVIIAAYDAYKDDCVQHFDGMFAFAIWNEKEKKLFASEMKALWAAGVPRKVNQKMLFNFLTIGYVDNPNQPGETFFENIYKLPPAYLLNFNPHNAELVIAKYWDLDIENENLTITDAEAIEKFQYLFQQSVKKRLRSDVPVGTSLSGGLDSSGIIAFSNGISASSYSHKAFTCVFPGFENDESVYAQQVAQRYNLQQYSVTANAADLATDLDKLMYHQEEPFGSASVYAQYKVFETAAAQNVKVLLDGQGADEILAGYHKYYKWYWQELFRKRKLFSSGELKAAKALGIKEAFGFNNILAALIPEFAGIFLERRYLLNALQHPDLDKEFIRLQCKEAYYTTPTIFGLKGILYFNTCIHGLEELLRFADRNSMAHGCEVRLPFLNHELVQFVFSLPSHFKIRQGWTKWLLRQSIKNELPEAIVWRKNKVGFEPPQKIWMQDAGIKELIMESKKKMVDEKILKPDVLKKSIQPKAAYEADNFDWRYLSAGLLFTPPPERK